MDLFYPPVGYFFTVFFRTASGFKPSDLLGILDINVKEVSGLTAEIGFDKYQEGGVNDYQHPLPKPAKFNNITLKRGLMLDSPMVEWIQEATQNFNIVPKHLTIILLGPMGIPFAAWDVKNCYPIKCEISGFNAMESAVVIESVELVCQKHHRILLSDIIPF